MHKWRLQPVRDLLFLRISIWFCALSAIDPQHTSIILMVSHTTMASIIDSKETGCQSICAKCSSIDFNGLFQEPFTRQALGLPASWIPASCELCKFFSDCLLPRSGNLEVYVQSKLITVFQRATKRLVRTDAEFERSALVLIQLHPSKSKSNQWWIAPSRNVISCESVPPIINFEWVRSWMTVSAPSHDGETILEDQTTKAEALGFQKDVDIDGAIDTALEPHVQPNQQMSHLRHDSTEQTMQLVVIDCQTRALIPAPKGEPYVTLSYVWGSVPAEIVDLSSKGPILPRKLPQTIEDAMTVCKSLDFRYLWVDRYCIPQQDLNERYKQIQQMDVIFSSSFLTLYACTGRDPNCGLPGVSRPRLPPPSIDIGCHGRFELVPSNEDISSGIWSSRGWTYQEALLATRRLYFTDRQLYYEDSSSLESELTSFCSKPPKAYWRFTPETIYTLPSDVYGCIQDYTTRSFSFRSDVLNAILGIFSVYDQKFGIRNLCGLPFKKDSPASVQCFRDVFPHFAKSLCWRTATTSSRRRGFPSWSWTGWTGKVFWTAVYNHELVPVPVDQGDLRVEVELISGQVLSWEQYQSSYEVLRYEINNISNFIHIEACITSIQFMGYVKSDQTC